MNDKNSQLRTRIEVMMTSLGLTQRVAKQVAKTLVEIHFEEYAATREAEGFKEGYDSLTNLMVLRNHLIEYPDDQSSQKELDALQKRLAEVQALTDTQGEER